MIEIYVDGSCRGNGKENSAGGWAVAAFQEGQCLTYFGEREENTTNNRMELTALLKALELTQTKNYKDKKCTIYCDSAYCVNICNEWVWNWYNKGWVRYNKQPIENLDLIKQIFAYISMDWPNFIIQKVAGHAGVLGNEICDAIAKNDLTKLAKIKKQNEEMFTMWTIFDLF